jgi:hypothetical protein
MLKILTKARLQHKAILFSLVSVTLTGCSESQSTEISLLNNRIVNTAGAYIPAQCYTKTKSERGKIHNPCFSCHTAPIAPNYINDSTLQLAYEFRDSTRKNPWSNLFKDRTEPVSKISNASILKYVRQSNYFDANGRITLAETMANIPKEWDVNGDGKWNGFTPDCYYNFDKEGFDSKPNGEMTGWRAFAYAPFLGTFWPTNGSTNDVIIRLAESFRKNTNGEMDLAIYKINLSIIQALIQRQNIDISVTDEKLYGVDLNRNGKLDIANKIVYRWAPKEGLLMSYVGKAKTLLEAKKLHLAAGLYPVGTEFLHSVRYIDIDPQGNASIANRFKELRYGIKTSWSNYSQLKNSALAEIKELHDFPDKLRRLLGNPETGLPNGLGWAYQGFIEDQKGQLRPQSFEESLNCMGCHSGVGVTTDSSFAFPRKLGDEQLQASWFHWSQKSLQGLPEPKFPDGTWQYTEYLLQNHSANEFRNNDEVIGKFFNIEGRLKKSEVETLHSDIAHLLLPSAERAMMLNKAYKVIVDEQSYVYGRDAHVEPVTTSWDIVPMDETTGIETPVIHH